MLFKFKSKACADLIMLDADGRRILKAMVGSDPVRGIVRVEDLSSAIVRLETAVAEDEALRKANGAGLTPGSEEDLAHLPPVRLAQRAAPMLQMLRRCQAEQADLVWGV